MGQVSAGVIGASFESIYAIKKAQDRGIRVKALDGNSNAPGLQYADESYVIDISDHEKVCSFLQEHPVDFLLPVPVGRILNTVGFVNDCFGFPGADHASIDLATDKWRFSQVLEKAGLRDAQTILLKQDTCCDQDSFRDLEYPAIIKPRFGSGSRGVKVVNTADELNNELIQAGCINEDLIVENCVQGKEYGVDALVIDHKLHMILLREKVLTSFPYRQCIGYFSVEKRPDNRDLFENIQSKLDRVINVIRCNACMLHVDLIIDHEKEPFIIELSPRPSGHYLHNYFTKYATGFDMLDYHLEYLEKKVRGERFPLLYEYSAQPMFIKYFDLKEGIISQLPDKEDLMQEFPLIAYECNLRAGDAIVKVVDGASVMTRGYYVLKVDTIEDAIELGKAINERFIIDRKKG